MTPLESKGSQSSPYLSVVIGCRNDDHGKGMLVRLQSAIDSLFEHASQHPGIEILLVEWNPPKNRPRLKEALNWDKANSGTTVQIIEVPNDLHMSLPFSDQKEFYQYHAKNVGIRRAKGKFVLSTNLDILLSAKLVSKIFEKGLNERTVYRADRVDIDQDTSESFRTLRAYRPWGIIDGPAEKSANSPMQKSPNANSKVKSYRWFIIILKFLILFIKNEFHRWTSLRKIRFNSLASFRKSFFEWKYTFGMARAWAFATFETRRYHQLHTGASGDFLLMSKTSWMELEGHPELPVHAMYLDGLTMYRALGLGYDFVNFPPDSPCYHIEHEGGWRPETQREYFENLHNKKIVYIHKSLYARWVESYAQGSTRFDSFYKTKNWGFSDSQLNVTTL